MIVSKEFLRFLAVGAVGFAIDGGLVVILVSQHADPLLARCFSFPSAVIATWWLNRVWTFAAAHKGPATRQITAYFLVQLVGALTNLMVYAAILTIIAPTPVNAFGAFALGSVAGLFVNFTGARRFAFAAATRAID
jgi:putative flippase GtrA